MITKVEITTDGPHVTEWKITWMEAAAIDSTDHGLVYITKCGKRIHESYISKIRTHHDHRAGLVGCYGRTCEIYSGHCVCRTTTDHGNPNSRIHP